MVEKECTAIFGIACIHSFTHTYEFYPDCTFLTFLFDDCNFYYTHNQQKRNFPANRIYNTTVLNERNIFIILTH